MNTIIKLSKEELENRMLSVKNQLAHLETATGYEPGEKTGVKKALQTQYNQYETQLRNQEINNIEVIGAVELSNRSQINLR